MNFVKSFNKVPLEVQNRSGFDMSHSMLLSGKVGTLVPVLTERMVSNDTISLGAMANVQLPPMAADFYGKCDLRLEAFFVPDRIVWGGYKYFYVAPPKTSLADTTKYPLVDRFPSLALDVAATGESAADLIAKMGVGSLSDYLGNKVNANAGSINVPQMLPYLAYHRIWNDFYRNKGVQKPIFCPPNTELDNETLNDNDVSCCPYVTVPSVGSRWTTFTDDDGIGADMGNARVIFPDGVTLLDLRQRNWDNDYFTCATLEPQEGLAPMTLPTKDNDITIPLVRQYNAYQRFIEKNNITPYDYDLQMFSHFGKYPSHECNKALFLGDITVNAYNKTVSQTGPSDGVTNPFTSIGSQRAVTRAVGDGSIVDSFTADEMGTFMVIASFVPTAYYSTGTARCFMDSELSDVPFPEFQGIGDQPIYQSELVDASDLNKSTSRIFGWAQRYAHLKYHRDEVAGLLRDGQSLSVFCLKRGFTGTPTLDGSFLQIPTSALNDVAAVSSDVSQYGWNAEIAFSQKMLRPYTVYSIPTIEDHQDTHTILVNKNGVRYSH